MRVVASESRPREPSRLAPSSIINYVTVARKPSCKSRRVVYRAGARARSLDRWLDQQFEGAETRFRAFRSYSWFRIHGLFVFTSASREGGNLGKCTSETHRVSSPVDHPEPLNVCSPAGSREEDPSVTKRAGRD